MTRDQILEMLLEQGVITPEESERIRAVARTDDNEETVIGYVRGMTRAASLPIANALEKEVAEIRAIRERDEPDSLDLSNVWTWLRGGTDEEKATRQAERQARREQTAMRTDAATAMRDEFLNAIEDAYEKGIVEKYALTQAQNAFTGKQPSEYYDSLMDTLERWEGMGVNLEPIMVDIQSIVQSTPMWEEERAAEVAASRPRVTDPQAELDQQAAAYRAAAQPLREEAPELTPEEERREAQKDINRARGGFEGLLFSLGILQTTVDAEGKVSFIDTSRTPLTSTVFEGIAPDPEQAVYDPSTGAVVPYSMILEMRNNEERLRAYTESATTPTWRRIQELYEDATSGGPGPTLPEEDLEGIIPSLYPDDPWERPIYSWQQGDAMAQWRSFSPEKRRTITSVMVGQGLIDPSLVDTLDYTDPFGSTQIAVWNAALGYSRDTQTDPLSAIYGLGRYAEAQRALQGSGPSGSVRAPFSAPAQYRTIPDYETLSQDVTEMMRTRLNGRDPEDWEVVLLADEMERQYKDFNREMIAAARDAYYDRSYDPDNPRRVPTPATRTTRKLEELYRPEIERLEQVEDTEVSNALMINAITKGAGMVGGY